MALIAAAALLTVVAIPSNAIAPIWLPLMATLVGVTGQVDPWAMALRLAVLVFGSFGLAALAVRVLGRPALRQAAARLDSWIVLLAAASAIPCMDGVGEAPAASPLRFIAMLAVALVC